MELKKIYVLDWYTSKHYELEVPSHESFVLGEKLIIEQEMYDGKSQQSIATYIGEMFSQVDRSACYIDRCNDQELEEFELMQTRAREKFPLFKKMFKEAFPSAVPVTARYHMFSRQYYFYFYAEQRFNFVEFIKAFRQELGAHFFLFQV